MWNKCNVVMLPTDEKTDIVLTHNGLFYTKHATMFLTLDRNYKQQHLYITSDEEIKIGDYCIDAKELFGPYEGTDTLINPSYKIIATTDTLSGLPLISQEFISYFIEQYNKGNVIKEVLVKYEDGKTCIVCGAYQMKENISCKYPKGGNTCCGGKLEFKIKTNSDNTINIKQIKDSWSKEEVIVILHKFVDKYTNHDWYDIYDKWIEENL